ncbi:hypothetical protein H113_00924 [Trichophyton rubrum MR1459]|nr:hypothetical protein H113_00924 [Trichophyton rubrum MR1459]
MLPEADPDMVINAFSPVPLGRGAHRDAESHQHAVPHMVGKKRYGRAERERWTPTGNMHMPHRQTPALNLGGDLKNVESSAAVEINSAFVIGRSKLRKAVERRKAGGDGPPLAAAYH